MTKGELGSPRYRRALEATGARLLDDPVNLGSFYCHAEIARGGQGTVYLGTGDVLARSRPCVIKALLHSDEATVARAERSIRLQLDLLDAAGDWTTPYYSSDDQIRPTPWVADVVAWDLNAPVPWIAQDFRGANLRKQRQQSTGHQDPDWLLANIAFALRFVHMNGVIHRDLKPENILVEQVKSQRHLVDTVVLCDFDLSKGRDQTTLTSTAAVGGTPGYSAPEQLWLSARDVTKAADIYSFAAVTVFLCTGFEPHEFLRGPHPWALTLESRAADMLGDRRPWVEQALSPRPEERPSLDDLDWQLHRSRVDR